MRVAARLLVFILLFFSRPAFVFASEADEMVAKIQKAYEGIKDSRGSFTQKSYVKDLKRTDTYKGQFYIKSPKMKWEYKGDKAQTVYITGEDIIIYQPKENQAFWSKFDRATFGQAPIALLGGFGDINKEFDVSMKGDKLHLKPKKPMGNIVYVELAASEGEFPIESLAIIDTLGNRVDVRLMDVKVNTGMKDKVFEFVPPKGINIIKQ